MSLEGEAAVLTLKMFAWRAWAFPLHVMLVWGRRGGLWGPRSGQEGRLKTPQPKLALGHLTELRSVEKVRECRPSFRLPRAVTAGLFNQRRTLLFENSFSNFSNLQQPP